MLDERPLGENTTIFGNQRTHSDSSSRSADLASPKRRWGRSLAGCVAAVMVGAFGFSLLGKIFFAGELLSNFRMYLLVGLVASAALSYSQRAWWMMGACLFGVAWATCGVLTVYATGTQPPPGPEMIRVMSYNVLGLNENHTGVAAEIRRHNPDVVAILEYTNRWPGALAALHDEYPYRCEAPRWHGFGVAIFSKRPLGNTNVLQLTRGVTDCPLAVVSVEVGGQVLQLAAVHLMSPRNSFRLSIRNQQLKEMASFFSSRQDLPTILLGDLNAVPWSPFVADFLRDTKLRDSRQGFGYQATWHAKRPYVQIPIDHALVSDHVHVHRRFVGNAAGSDHWPIIVDVSVSNLQ